MGEAEDRYQKMLAGLREASNADDAKARAQDWGKALYELANDLTYPIGDDGSQVNIHWLIPILSSHLAKCGYRKHEELATIKQIPHPRRGHAQVAEDAVLYVPVDASGLVPRAFVPPTPQEQPVDPVNDQWKTRTHITMDGETIKGRPLDGTG